jgi:hypothetical protein
MSRDEAFKAINRKSLLMTAPDRKTWEGDSGNNISTSFEE